jgi:dimethylargininase
MKIALTREVSPKMASCELTHVVRENIDIQVARSQHLQYEHCLANLGCRIERLPDAPELPDSVFVEDTAIVLDEVAIITRPGTASRQPETLSVGKGLEPYRKLHRIESPGTLDGGDVLRIGKKLFVGAFQRSNKSGMMQLQEFVSPFGYTVITVEITDCLHLKSAVTQVAENTMLINPAWVDAGAFMGMDFIEVSPSEPFGANALLLDETVVYPVAFVETRKRLQDHGIDVKTVDVAELSKAEGGVTCCSILFDA